MQATRTGARTRERGRVGEGRVELHGALEEGDSGCRVALQAEAVAHDAPGGAPPGDVGHGAEMGRLSFSGGGQRIRSSGMANEFGMRTWQCSPSTQGPGQ